jgi:hypothetical protein
MESSGSSYWVHFVVILDLPRTPFSRHPERNQKVPGQPGSWGPPWNILYSPQVSLRGSYGSSESRSMWSILPENFKVFSIPGIEPGRLKRTLWFRAIYVLIGWYFPNIYIQKFCRRGEVYHFLLVYEVVGRLIVCAIDLNLHPSKYYDMKNPLCQSLRIQYCIR